MMEFTLIQLGTIALAIACAGGFIITLIAQKFFKYMAIMTVLLFIISFIFPVQTADLINNILGVVL